MEWRYPRRRTTAQILRQILDMEKHARRVANPGFCSVAGGPKMREDELGSCLRRNHGAAV